MSWKFTSSDCKAVKHLYRGYKQIVDFEDVQKSLLGLLKANCPRVPCGTQQYLENLLPLCCPEVADPSRAGVTT